MYSKQKFIYNIIYKYSIYIIYMGMSQADISISYKKSRS